MPLSHLAGLGQRTSPYIKYCIRWRNHQPIRFGRRTAHMNVYATNMGRLTRSRNEHKTGQSTVCYRMSNEHKPNVERMKRTNNKCLPDTTNIQRKNNEQTGDIYRTIRTHPGQLPNMCAHVYQAHSISLRFKCSSKFGGCSKLSGELNERCPSVTFFGGWQQDINRTCKEHKTNTCTYV